jgi:transcription-repair coupling factor (superfamily II helicase)
MSLSALGSLLDEVPQYRRLTESLRRPRARVKAQVLQDAVPFVLANLCQGLGTPALIVTPRPEDARRLHEQLVVWSGRQASVLHFPESETLPFERLVSDVDTVHERLHTLSALCATEGQA